MLDALNHPVVFLLGLSIGIAAVWAILRVVLDKVGLSQFAALFGGGKSA